MSGRRSRGLAALSVVICVAAQWTAHVHLATTTHVRCVEHGELVDVADATATGVNSGIRTTTPGAGDDHHCLAALQLGASAEAAPTFGAITTIAAATLGAVAPGERDVPRRPVLAFAPKTSPPGRARRPTSIR